MRLIGYGQHKNVAFGTQNVLAQIVYLTEPLLWLQIHNVVATYTLSIGYLVF